MGEDIKPLFTVNAMQGECSQCCAGCPPPSVPVLSDVVSREAQDTSTVSGHIMGMTHKLFD